MKKMKAILASVLLAGSLCCTLPAHSLEFQWKYVIPTMDSREKAVQIYELLNSIIGVYDVTVNMDSNSLMLFYDDEKTDEAAIKKVLQAAEYPVEKMMLLKEPKEGMMN